MKSSKISENWKLVRKSTEWKSLLSCKFEREKISNNRTYWTLLISVHIFYNSSFPPMNHFHFVFLMGAYNFYWFSWLIILWILPFHCRMSAISPILLLNHSTKKVSFCCIYITINTFQMNSSVRSIFPFFLVIFSLKNFKSCEIYRKTKAIRFSLISCE